jgi:hypothetical protein
MNFDQVVDLVKEDAKSQNVKVVEDFQFLQRSVGNTGYADGILLSDVPADVTIGRLQDGRRAIAIRGSITEDGILYETETTCLCLFERYVDEDRVVVGGGGDNVWQLQGLFSWVKESVMRSVKFGLGRNTPFVRREDTEENVLQSVHKQNAIIVVKGV